MLDSYKYFNFDHSIILLLHISKADMILKWNFNENEDTGFMKTWCLKEAVSKMVHQIIVKWNVYASKKINSKYSRIQVDKLWSYNNNLTNKILINILMIK